MSKIGLIPLTFLLVLLSGSLGKVAAQEPTKELEWNKSRLHPSPTWINFDVMRSLEKKPNRTDVLVRQKRGKSTEFENLGSVYLPLP